MAKLREFKVSRHWPLAMKPYEIQNIAFDRARDHAKWGHWLEQGIGKTLVTYAEFVDHVRRGLVDCMIVIAPSFLMTNWQTEAIEYGIEWPVILWPDVPTAKQMRSPFVMVFNTEAIIQNRRGGVFLRQLIKDTRQRVFMAVDESVCIANFRSDVSKTVIEIGYDAPYHRALSGLPTPENAMQWWPQLRFCGAINGVNPYQFRNRYAITGGFMGKQLLPGIKPDRAEELEGIINSCGIRAMKEDWLDLPAKIQCPPFEFDLEPRQQHAYDQMLNEFYAEVDAHPEGAVMADYVIHQLMKLQQISRGFIMDQGEVVAELVEPKKNPALKALKQALDVTRGKAIIFTQYKHSTRMVFDYCESVGYETVVLRGGLEAAEIRERKDAFNRDPKVRGIIGQLDVTKRGHTLLGGAGEDRCSTSIFFENMYSRDTRSQAEDRNHRHGQDMPVSYIDLVEQAKRSPTRRALDALRRKQDFIDSTLNAMRTRRADVQ